MIHFYDDWDFYPNATIQENTTNTSFLHYADVLAKMGVRNNLFHLSLLNPLLKDVDPFDPEIIKDPLMCDMIFKEIKSNFWYYQREICRFKGQGSAEPMVFRAHRANMAFSWVTHLNIDVNCTLARQRGKSVGADTTNSYHVNLAGEGLQVQLYTKDNALRVQNVAKIKAMRELLPPYLNFFDPSVDSDNNAEVTCKAFGNHYMTAVAQKTEDGAENTGRGLSAPRQQMDELPFCANCRISVPASMGGTTATRRLAMKQGSPYGLMVTTTAGKKDTKDGKFAYDLIHGGIDWHESLLDLKNKAELDEVIVKNRRGKRMIINVTMNHRQLGVSDKEFIQDIENAGTDREQTERDYLNKWTSGGIYSPISAQLNNIIHKAIREPKYVEMTKHNFMVSWHVGKNNLESYLDKNYCVMTLDSSNAVGGDGNGLKILNLKTMDTVAASNVNTTSLETYSSYLANLLIKYPKLTLIVENKSSGQAIMDFIAGHLIRASINPFTRMYNRVVQDGNNLCPRLSEIKTLKNKVPNLETYEKYKRYFGFMTTGKTRDYLYNSVFRAAAEACGHLVRDKDTSDQIRSLELKNGRIDHPKGGNDDMVISWLLGHHFAKDGRNIDFYDIPLNYVMTEVSKNGATMTEDEVRKAREQAMYKARAEEYKEELKKASDEFERSMIRLRLTKVLSFIDDDSEEWTIEAIRKECEKPKKKLHERLRY